MSVHSMDQRYAMAATNYGPTRAVLRPRARRYLARAVASPASHCCKLRSSLAACCCFSEGPKKNVSWPNDRTRLTSPAGDTDSGRFGLGSDASRPVTRYVVVQAASSKMQEFSFWPLQDYGNSCRNAAFLDGCEKETGNQQAHGAVLCQMLPKGELRAKPNECASVFLWYPFWVVYGGAPKRKTTIWGVVP